MGGILIERGKKKEEEKEVPERRNIISKGQGLGHKVPIDLIFSPASPIITWVNLNW